ncbi:MAG: hypothetical protein AB9869_12755 [Verrucomicrobiia bacterium]
MEEESGRGSLVEFVAHYREGFTRAEVHQVLGALIHYQAPAEVLRVFESLYSDDQRRRLSALDQARSEAAGSLDGS